MKPTQYTQELADKVCEYIMDGYSLRKIALIDEMPSRFTILRWLRETPEFQIQYAHAREEQAEFYADEIIEIADTETDSAKARVRVDSRKWVASKLKAKKYGDTLKHTGDPDQPISQKHSLEVHFVGNTDRDTAGV